MNSPHNPLAGTYLETHAAKAGKSRAPLFIAFACLVLGAVVSLTVLIPNGEPSASAKPATTTRPSQPSNQTTSTSRQSTTTTTVAADKVRENEDPDNLVGIVVTPSNSQSDFPSRSRFDAAIGWATYATALTITAIVVLR